MPNLTTIRIDISTRDKLKFRGQKSESYNTIIRRLLALTTRPTKHDILKGEASLFLENKFGCKDIDFEVKRTLFPSNKGCQFDVIGFLNGKSYGVECTSVFTKHYFNSTKKTYFKLVDFLFLCYKRSGQVKFIQIKDKGFTEIKNEEIKNG